jgi:hypothetical protein
LLFAGVSAQSESESPTGALNRLHDKYEARVTQARRDALEEAARVAEGKVYKELYRTWPWWLCRDGSQGNASNERDLVQHADKIAAAIRALKGEGDV